MISYMILIVESAYIQYKLYISTMCHLDTLKMSHVTCRFLPNQIKTAPFGPHPRYHRSMHPVWDWVSWSSPLAISPPTWWDMKRLTSRNDSLTTNKNLLAKDKRTQMWWILGQKQRFTAMMFVASCKGLTEVLMEELWAQTLHWVGGQMSSSFLEIASTGGGTPKQSHEFLRKSPMKRSDIQKGIRPSVLFCHLWKGCCILRLEAIGGLINLNGRSGHILNWLVGWARQWSKFSWDSPLWYHKINVSKSPIK